jgi:hypothetical protein
MWGGVSWLGSFGDRVSSSSSLSCFFVAKGLRTSAVAR